MIFKDLHFLDIKDKVLFKKYFDKKVSIRLYFENNIVDGIIVNDKIFMTTKDLFDELRRIGLIKAFLNDFDYLINWRKNEKS